MRTRDLILNRARTLRKSMSEPEVMLWTRLRGRSSDKPRFRRQHPFGSVILDFYCPSARLAIEVDGWTHWDEDSRARDAARDRWLVRQVVTVVRIPAADIYRDLSAVADAVIRRATEFPLPPRGKRRVWGLPPPPPALRRAVPLPPRAARGR